MMQFKLRISSLRTQLVRSMIHATTALMLFTISLMSYAQTSLGTDNIYINMTVGQSFSQNFIGTGNIDNSYSLSGSLPAGISISTVAASPPSTSNHEMTLSGTPTAAGSYTFNINVTATNAVAVSNYTSTLVVTVSSAIPSANDVNHTVFQNSASNILSVSTSGDVNTINIITRPTQGTATISGTNIVYTPRANFYGQDQIVYTASGPGGTSSAASISINVMPIAPSVNSVSTTVNANSSSTITPTILGTATSISIARAPSSGRATVNGLSIDYTPNNGFTGTDVIVINATGPGGTSVAANITVTVAASAPTVSINNANVVNDGRSTRITPNISGIATRLDLVTPPAHGSAVVNGLSIDYTPLAGYAGDDSFSVTATGPGGSSSAARANITVTPPAPVVSPVASTIVANSSDNRIRPTVSGIVNSIAITTPPNHGTASVSGLEIIYVPVTGFVGNDSLGVTAYGPGGSSSVAQLSISVTAPPPVITASTVNVFANSNANSITPLLTGLVANLSLATSSKHGTASVNGLNIIYTPEAGYVGSDSVSVIATGLGGTTAPVSITIDVKPITGTSIAQTVDANSKDTRLNLPSILGAQAYLMSAAPSHGTININGLNVSYTPSTNFVGKDFVRLAVNGNNGSFTSVDINLSITAPAPIASRALLSVESGRSARIDLAPYISGPQLSGLNLSISAAPAHGTASVNGTTLTYTANASYTGSDRLLFVASAIGGSSLPGELIITVNARPNPAIDRGVTAIHNATTAVVRHFEQVQIDQFTGRMLEIASQNRPKQDSDTSGANRACSGNGAWLSGLNSYGSYRGRDGSHYTTMGYSLGTDRCFGSNGTVAGFGIGYARDHSEMPSSGAAMTASANTIASYITSPIIPKLRISFVAGVNQVGNRYQRWDDNTSQLAYGEWKGNQAFSSSAVSGDLDISIVKISPFVKFDLSNLSLAPYDETGNTPNILHYHQQSMRSQRSTAGFNSEMKIETPWGLLIPRLRMEVQRDAAKRSSLKVNYVDYPDAVFLVPANDTDRRVSLIAIGADMNWSNGIVTILSITRTSGSQANQNNRINLRLSYSY